MIRRTALTAIFCLLLTSAVYSQQTRTALSLGNPRAEFRVEVFYDFQCPACTPFHESLKKILERYPERVLVIVRHFPMPLHEKAFLASSAVEAANRQGKGIEMIELILNGQEQWTADKKYVAVFGGYAERLGLDLKAFKSDLTNDDVIRTVLYDLNRGKRLGVSATPTTFLNGKQLSFPDALELENIIQKAIDQR